MTREEAIERYTSNAEYERTHGNLQGYLEFKQLAEWLKDYKQLLEQEPVIEPLERLAESASKTAKVLERLKISEQEPLTEENYIELNDRFGDYVVWVVRDMVSGKGERWKEWNKEWNDKPLAESEPQERK